MTRKQKVEQLLPNSPGDRQAEVQPLHHGDGVSVADIRKSKLLKKVKEEQPY